jgi:hypothetical protein
VRSSGLEYELSLAKGLPILGKAINFHDPYPLFFDTSGSDVLTKAST